MAPMTDELDFMDDGWNPEEAFQRCMRAHAAGEDYNRLELEAAVECRAACALASFGWSIESICEKFEKEHTIHVTWDPATGDYDADIEWPDVEDGAKVTIEIS
jgi:hypothetical protein